METLNPYETRKRRRCPEPKQTSVCDTRHGQWKAILWQEQISLLHTGTEEENTHSNQTLRTILHVPSPNLI
jgi:hypothetical protein